MSFFRYILSNNDGWVADLAIAIFLFLVSAISTSLNPLVFYYNYKKKKSVPRLLFQILAVSDFCTGLLNPIHIALDVMDDDGPYDSFYGHNVTVVAKVHGSLTWFLDFYPCSITALLTISRFIQIKYPFCRISMKFIVTVLVGWALCQYSFIVAVMLTDDVRWLNYVKLVWSDTAFGLSRTNILFWWMSGGILMQVASIVASSLTICVLIQQSRQSLSAQSNRNSVRGSVKIIITNFGSFCYLIGATSISCMSIGYDKSGKLAEDALNIKHMWNTFVILNMMPVVLSAFNPVVFILFTREVCSCSKISNIRGSGPPTAGAMTSTTKL